MVLIFSENGDLATSRVIEWLNTLNVDCCRVNREDFDVFGDINIDDRGRSSVSSRMKIDPKLIWFRRGRVNTANKANSTSLKNSPYYSKIKSHIDKEYSVYTEFVYEHFKDICINSPRHYEVNKVLMLTIAGECGFMVPETIVTQDKAKLSNFVQKNGIVISKALSDNLILNDKYQVSQTFKFLEKEGLKNVNDVFQSSFFQKYIRAVCEVRIFYFMGSIFCTAQFPRSWDVYKKKGITKATQYKRHTSLALPKGIVENVHRLMQKLNMKSGSIDLLYTDKDEYYFLELNPIGQFGFVNKIGDFNIYKHIAQTMKNCMS